MKQAFVLLALIVAIPAAAQAPVRHGGLPAVSPDGRRIVFVAVRSDSVDQIYAMNSDGSGTIQLTHSRDDKGAPAWSADGKEVFWSSQRGDSAFLYGVPDRGGPSHRLVAIAGKSLAPSPDGRQLAFTKGTWTRNRIMVGRSDGSAARAVTDSAAGYFKMAWSPDDRQIAAARRDSTGNLQVWVLDLGADTARALTHFEATDGRPEWPAWSPDGRKIALQAAVHDREHPEKSTSHLWLIDVASGSATKLAPHDRPWLDETPSWFPDGKRLAFQSTRTSRTEIWVMDASGAHARQLTK